MGGEMGAFIPSDSGVTETTSLTYVNFDAAFARSSIGMFGGTAYCEGTLASGQTDVWLHFDMVTAELGIGTVSRLIWQNASGTDSIRMRHNPGAETLAMEYWNGAAWTAAGATISISIAGRQTFDLHVVCNSGTGSIDLYVAGTHRITSGAIDLSGTTSLKTFRFYGGTAGPNTDHTFISQCIVSDAPTVGGRLFTVPISGAGATSSWTGSYTEIDEIVYSDADFINSASVNQVSTFAIIAPTLTGYQVQAVAVTARAKRGASGPQNLQLALRSAGTNYFSSSQALDVGYGAFINIWETDPATSAAFTNSAIASLQPGVKSIT